MNEPATVRAVDGAALVRLERRQALMPEPPWLHTEVARRMAERLPLIKQMPAVVIDWNSHAGASAGLLRAAYPKARCLHVEPPGVPPRAAAPWWSVRRWKDAPPLTPREVPPEQAQLLWANMMLHAAADPGALLLQWQRALSIDGFLMFSTLGPDSLRSLRELYRDAGWGVAHAPFVDMHDLGDMLLAARLADPVVDQERLRLTWASPEALLAELRGLGINAALDRHAGLRTPRWRARLRDALAERADANGRISLDFEIVYGHAFKPMPRASVASETRLSAADLQRMARRGQRPV